MQTLLDLEKLCKDLPDRIEQEVNELAKGLIIETGTLLIRRTPVDTSRAASNWQGSIGSPYLSIRLPYYTGRKGSTAELSKTAALEELKLVMSKKLPGEVAYLSNSVHYVKALNDGSSVQDPGGFFEAALLLGQHYLERKT
jgi:hypothetical protein